MQIAFLDIEGAFNNVHPEAIVKVLQKLNVVTALVQLKCFMLTKKNISSNFGSCTTRGKVNRGSPQGRLISPILWVAVLNDLLKLIESHGYNIIVYADDVAITVQGKYSQFYIFPLGTFERIHVLRLILCFDYYS